MGFPHPPQLADIVPGEECTAVCGACSTFPSPFRRVGEAAYCRFAPLRLAARESVTFSADGRARLVFVLSGALVVGTEGGGEAIEASHCACFACDGCFELLARDATHAVVLSLVPRFELREEDVFGDGGCDDGAAGSAAISVVPMHRSVERLLSELFVAEELNRCARYHRMKATELFMMIRVLYPVAEQARFFRSMIRSVDDFRAFVRNNYERVQGVGELAALAGMSLSAFKRRFAEQFHDSVYHWMMRQKALCILADIRDGERNTRVLMEKYGFRHYTQFSRFCKSCLQATPARLIATGGYIEEED